MQLLSTSGSLSLAHTTSRLAASWTCPFMVMAIGVLRRFALRYRARAGRGESAFIAGRHCAHGMRADLAHAQWTAKGFAPRPIGHDQPVFTAGEAWPASALQAAKGETMVEINADGCKIHVEVE